MAIDYSNLAYGQQYFPEEVDETVTETVYPNKPFLYGDLNPYRSETEKFRTRFDPTQIQAAPEKRKFSLNPLDWGVMGLMKRMVEPNTPEENFGRGYFKDTMDSSGRVYNDAGDLFGGKNVVSAWGEGMGAAAQKRIDKINQTLSDWEAKAAEGDEEAMRRLNTTTLYNRRKTFQQQLGDYNKKLADATGTKGSKTYITKKTTPGGDAASRDQGGGYSTRGGFTGTRSTAGPRGTSTPASGRGHHSWAQGGRVGIRMGGDRTGWMTEPENVTPFQLQQEEGVPMGLMASDDVNTRILENLFEKYLDLGFSPPEAERLAMEEFESMAQGPQEEVVEEGIASLV